MAPIDPNYVARARDVAALVAPLAERIEAERRLPAEVVRALVDANLFKLVVAKKYGGEEASIATLLAVIEEVARADGSAGWCVMINATSGLMSAFLDDAVAREVFAPRDAITCGVFAPMGRAKKVDGGWRVSGRWPFASGCEHSTWRMGGAMVEGEPGPRSFLFRADETRVLDTWNVSGLRGTGSHDIAVDDVLVPDARAFSLLEPRLPLPFFGVLAASVAAVTLGIARGAVDAFVELARAKHPQGGKKTLAHRELVQLQVAQAEGKVRAARALLFEAIDGGSSIPARAQLRLAACHAAAESAAAVDLVYAAGGASSIYAASPLQRCFRDVHTATAHVMVSATSATLAGRVLLGVETDVTLL
jgi:alkylation response protein AidB-like acyl-CoA dehydrogenase